MQPNEGRKYCRKCSIHGGKDHFQRIDREGSVLNLIELLINFGQDIPFDAQVTVHRDKLL